MLLNIGYHLPVPAQSPQGSAPGENKILIKFYDKKFI